MAIKRILGVLAGLASDTRIVAAARMTAERFSARADFLFVRDLEQRLHMAVGFDIAVMPPVDYADGLRVRLAEREAAAAAAAAEFAGAGFMAIAGTYAQIVAERGGAYDLVIEARPDDKGDQGARIGVEAALFDSGVPVLLVPPVMPPTLGKIVLVAWNRSIPARRALSAALPWLTTADKVVVFHVATGSKHGPTSEAIVELLAAHGVKAELREMAPDKQPVALLLREARIGVGADLLVMGAYSTSRFREMILGGVTRHALAHAEVPLLMAD